MAEYAVEGTELKKLIGAARKKPLPFAYNPGKGDGDDYFALHRKRSADVMAKTAKKEGSGAKVAYGTCKVDGSVMWLTCDEAVPSMAKKLKKFLKSQKVSLTIKVTDLSGNILDEEIETNPDIEPLDVEDEEEDEAAEDAAADEAPAAAGQAAPDAAPDAAEIVARIKAAQPCIAAAPAAVSGKLMDALKAAAGLVKSGDLNGAAEGISKIEAVLAKLAAAAGQPQPAQATPEAAAAGAELVARAKALQPRIAAAPQSAAAQLQAALAAVVARIKAREFDAAEAGLGKIEAALDKLSGQSAPATGEGAAAQQDPRTAKLREAAAALRAKVEALAAGRTADALLAQLARVDAMIGAGEVEEAVTGLKTIQAALKLQAEEDRLTPAGASDQAADIDAEVRPFALSRVKWRETRVMLGSEMERLKASILSVCQGHESLSDVAAKVDGLFDYLSGLDSRLEDKLDEVVNAPTGSERDKRKDEARALLAEYRGTLQEPFFKAVDNGNGFTQVSITSTAETALSEIASAIAA